MHNTKKIEINNDLKNKIIELYNDGFNRLKISKELNLTEWTVRKTIKGLSSGSERLKLFHEKNSIKLTKHQFDLIIGSLLGDASLIYRKKGINFQVGHCKEQQEYLEHKAHVLGSTVRSYIKGKDSYSCGKEFFITHYHNRYELLKIYKLLYKQDKKCVSNKIDKLLNERSIAYWFMDDGTSSFYRKNSVICRLSTLSFTLPEVEILRKTLLKFGIITTIHNHTDGTKLVINIKKKSINDFMDMIEPHIVPCMAYKIKRNK